MTWIRTASGPDPPGSSRCPFKRRKTPVPRVLLSITLAGPAPSGSSGYVPALSGPLSPSPASPGSGCPQLQPCCCDSGLVQVFHLHSNQQRLTAQTEAEPEPEKRQHSSTTSGGTSFLPRSLFTRTPAPPRLDLPVRAEGEAREGNTEGAAIGVVAMSGRTRTGWRTSPSVPRCRRGHCVKAVGQITPPSPVCRRSVSRSGRLG